MPITKSAKKQMRQNKVRRARNFMMRSLLKTHFKKALLSIKSGDAQIATSDISVAYSIIDTAVKKKIIHKNNAANKKSRLARGLNDLVTGVTKKDETTKPAKKAPKKTVKKATKKA